MSRSAQTPPVAPVIEHHETRHGTTVSDNYFWLREKSNPQVIKYLEAENAYTEAMTKGLKPFEDALYQEMVSHIKETDWSVPVRRGGYYYYSRTEEGKQYPIECRKKGSLEAKEDGALGSVAGCFCFFSHPALWQVKLRQPSHLFSSRYGMPVVGDLTYVVALRSPIPSSVSTALPGLRTTRRCF